MIAFRLENIYLVDCEPTSYSSRVEEEGDYPPTATARHALDQSIPSVSQPVGKIKQPRRRFFSPQRLPKEA